MSLHGRDCDEQVVTQGDINQFTQNFERMFDMVSELARRAEANVSEAKRLRMAMEEFAAEVSNQ